MEKLCLINVNYSNKTFWRINIAHVHIGVFYTFRFGVKKDGDLEVFCFNAIESVCGESEYVGK